MALWHKHVHNLVLNMATGKQQFETPVIAVEPRSTREIKMILN